MCSGHTAESVCACLQERPVTSEISLQFQLFILVGEQMETFGDCWCVLYSFRLQPYLKLLRFAKVCSQKSYSTCVEMWVFSQFFVSQCNNEQIQQGIMVLVLN